MPGRYFRNFFKDRHGNIAVLSALMLTSLVGVAGLVTDYGTALYNRLRDQHIADIAAVAGARIYDETESATAVATAVANIAALNGVPASAISESIVSSPSGDGNEAVKIVVNTSSGLIFTRVLQPGKSSLAISASAYAEMKPGGAGCIIALKTSGTGVTLSGGATLTASNCAVASDQTVNCANSSNVITTKYVYYNTSALNCGGTNGTSWIVPPSGSTLATSEVYTADPLQGTSEVLGATGRLASVESITSPSGPSVSGGTAVAFGYSVSAVVTALATTGCTGTFSSPVWTVTCADATGSGTHTFGQISLSGGITVNFNVNGNSADTYNFNGEICDSGTALHFGSGTFNIVGGVYSGGGSNTTFGSGTFNIGKIPSSNCGGTAGYSIYNTGSIMTYGSSTTASKFTLAGAIYNKGGETLVMGGSCTNGGSACTQTSSSNTFASATGNSFNIGSISSSSSCGNTGDSFCMGGGAATYFGDASGSSNLFQMAGNFDVGSGGGSCVWIGSASEHDINGFFSTAGGNILGSGVYTVAKYMDLGAGGGGNVTCGGSSMGMSAANVTVVVGGTSLDGSGNAFFVGAGYSTVTFTAPTSGNTQELAVIGPTTSTNTGTVSFGEGASGNNVTGAFYFPYGAITLSGAANVSNGSSGCLELIGSQVTLVGGSSLASSCNIPGVGTSGTSGLVSLVM